MINITSDGRVGIRDTTPQEELSIKSANPAISFEDNDDGTIRWELNSNPTSSIFDIASITSGTTRSILRMNNLAPANSLVFEGTSGQVGMGTSSPSAGPAHTTVE